MGGKKTKSRASYMKDVFLDNLIGIFGRISIFGTGRSGPQLHAVQSGGGFK